ncbi:hypothetical protein [Enterococcus cecorum]|uniref:hypothetical protein n=1 Tax=Enterococcus cecorum TaxID=44008 RepID=UPI00200AAA9E|nr:hypothetical protein [Enterococcus cecorum]MDZ5585309.1 hypothetical protein [Enterococcus cecorum]
MCPIYSIEGNVHSGKTTLLNSINCKNTIKLTENKKPLFKSYVYSQISYIYQEIIRKFSLLKTRRKNYILDRSFLSILIFNSFVNHRFSNFFVRLIFYLAKHNLLIFPNKILLLYVPYLVTKERHSRLHKNKNTDFFLIDYFYFSYYILFFKNIMKSTVTKTHGFQYFLLGNIGVVDLEINLNNIKFKNKICLDGLPATGKTFILNTYFRNKIVCLDENTHYKKFTVDNAENQINLIVNRIKIMDFNNDSAIDTSFLTAICYLFYNKNTEISKNKKLEWIEEIYSKVTPFHYITRIIYMKTDQTNMKRLKNLDISKKRAHFEDNLKMKTFMDNFFHQLNNELKNKLNIKKPIYFLDITLYQGKKLHGVLDSISTEKKPILVLDILFCIRELIERGKI